MPHTLLKSSFVALLISAAAVAGLDAQKKDVGAKDVDAALLPASIWKDPGDIRALDLIYGAGGRADAPALGGSLTFVSEDLLESSPKFEATDASGTSWKVKLGEESQAETAATRFLWAAGYFVDEDYYVGELTVRGLPKLHRGEEFVARPGVVRGARLERKRKTVKKLGDWDWFDNPFLDQREFNGLRVMMSLVNNWDLKQVNNSVYVSDGERRYVVTDVGATIGNTGNALTRSKNVPKDYEDSKFVAKDSPGFIDFVLHSRPFILGKLDGANCHERTQMEEITKHIPRADARWLGQRLGMMTEDQIRDGFRAAGYGAADVDGLTAVIRLRIAALGAL